MRTLTVSGVTSLASSVLEFQHPTTYAWVTGTLVTGAPDYTFSAQLLDVPYGSYRLAMRHQGQTQVTYLDGLYSVEPPASSNGGLQPFLYAADYGADRMASAAINTSAINQAIQDAITTRQIVVLPGGRLSHVGIEWDCRVPLMGQGRFSTTLVSTTAQPALQRTSTLLDVKTAGIQNIGFDGANIGTTAIALTAVAYAKVSDIFIEHFTDWGATLDGCIFNHWTNVWWCVTQKGIKIRDAVISSPAENSQPFPMPNNLTHFQKCRWQYVPSGYCVDSDGASMVTIDQHCDFEQNGTTGDSESGCIRWAGGFEKTIIGLKMDDCWFERNKGGALIDIRPGTYHTRHHIANSSIRNIIDGAVNVEGQNISGTCAVGVRVTSQGNFDAEVLLTGNAIVEHPEFDVQVSGLRAKVRVNECRIDKFEELNGGSYKVLQYGVQAATPVETQPDSVGAYRFGNSGTAQNLTFANPAAMDFSNGFTFAVWVNLTNPGDNFVAGRSVSASQGAYDFGAFYNDQDPNAKIQYFTAVRGINGSYLYSVQDEFTAGRARLVFIWDGTSNTDAVRVYRNNTLLSNDAGNAGIWQGIAAGGSFTIGAPANYATAGPQAQSKNATIDCFYALGRALTPQEVAEDYNQGIRNVVSDLSFLSELQIALLFENNLLDSSGKNNHASATTPNYVAI